MRIEPGSRRFWLFAILLLSGIEARAAPDTMVDVKGRVLASFDEGHAIVSTGRELVRLDVAKLGFLQRQELMRLPLRLRLRVPREAIDFVWQLNPEPGAPAPVASYEPREKLASHDGIVEIVGRKLPSVPSEVAYVRVRDRVYAIDTSQVPRESRSRLEGEQVNAYVPQGAVMYSWLIESAAPQEVAPEYEGVEMVGGRLRIAGRAVYSFDTPYALVQADDTVLQLRRSQLNAEQQKAVDRVGNQVHLKVPGKAVEFSWRVGQPRRPMVSDVFW